MIRLLKPIVFLACLAPLARLAWKAYSGNLGANPIEVITGSSPDSGNFLSTPCISRVTFPFVLS